jgi:hypothetical protein
MGKKGKRKVQHAWMEETPETPLRAIINELYRAHHRLISGTLDTQTLAILLKQVILHLEVPETVVVTPEPVPVLAQDEELHPEAEGSWNRNTGWATEASPQPAWTAPQEPAWASQASPEQHDWQTPEPQPAWPAPQ